ncbi:hypothetical protein PAPYR_4486 [Paratrimastix pyriformis]|uniref:Uncharacterized protein n=1 Tax=Paratrimastix pyriformis TaxID=342808 RepID=A0ABQ8UPJ1_9EUKA|nr:hypothetical protein PAPYR_4486 [Paratrimastix pyriformis]
MNPLHPCLSCHHFLHSCVGLSIHRILFSTSGILHHDNSHRPRSITSTYNSVLPEIRPPELECPRFKHRNLPDRCVDLFHCDRLADNIQPAPDSISVRHSRYCLFRTPPSPSLARSRVSIRPTPSDKVNSGFNRRLPSWQTFLLSILNHGGLTIFGISALPFFSEY